MDPDEPADEREGRPRPRRHRRAWWKRKRIWIAVISSFVAILLALWLISSLGSHHDVD